MYRLSENGIITLKTEKWQKQRRLNKLYAASSLVTVTLVKLWFHLHHSFLNKFLGLSFFVHVPFAFLDVP